MADIFVITRQHSCARFVDLDTSTKEKVLEKYRDYNTDGFDWWDCVYWDFEERMKAHGVTVDLKKTFFRLSYSQGDYASFAAQVTDLDAFLKELGGFDKKAIRLIKYALMKATYRQFAPVLVAAVATSTQALAGLIRMMIFAGTL